MRALTLAFMFGVCGCYGAPSPTACSAKYLKSNELKYTRCMAEYHRRKDHAAALRKACLERDDCELR